ncbi:MAG: 30S ribosomal protein S21, partial [Myxococcales bacterium]|nr:30S ribosomal protein S21 [Myxococcales bacterium]MBL9044386.1 30S ribosomal protein S21 [Myxococcales bacterium]
MPALIGKPLEVEVRDNLEKAMKILKQKMSKEGILQEVKRRRFYEK